MTAYRVADAKTNLPRLIDRALLGEGAPQRRAAPATYAWLQSRRKARSPAKQGSVALLNNLDDDPGAKS